MSSRMPALAAVFMASGYSKRFQGNKLLEKFNGKPLAEIVLEKHPAELFLQTVVVTRYPQIALAAAQRGFTIVEYPDETDNIAETIRLGMKRLLPAIEGCMFSVCDQPLLAGRSIQKLSEAFLKEPEQIWALGYQGRRGNPVIFPKKLFGELAALEPNQSGGSVIARHPDCLRIQEIQDSRELLDIDSRGDLAKLQNESGVCGDPALGGGSGDGG